MRLDVRVAKLLSVSRNRAQFFVESGLVSIAGVTITKPSHEVSEIVDIEIKDHPQVRYVSRSAQKLADFLDTFAIDVTGLRCLDIGSSTGGFTQVLLEKRATHVVAVDVGTEQLHTTLRSDARITSLENTDIRGWQSDEKFLCIVTDVSFISLTEILPSITKHLDQNGFAILLFKPQFEVGKEGLTKLGIPKSEKLRTEAIVKFEKMVQVAGFSISHTAASTLEGEAGNREVLYCLQKV